MSNSDENPSSRIQHFGASYWAGVHEHALVGYFVGAYGDRDRFTLAHELAHIVLHTFRPHVPSDYRETEANGFAEARRTTKLAGDDHTALTLVATEYGRTGFARQVRERGVGFVGWQLDGETAIVTAWPVERDA